MIPSSITIATRRSPLAIAQSEIVKQQLQIFYPSMQVELLPLQTKGDRFLGQPLADIGGKGLFIKELEQAMLDGKADIAVHSLKDMPHQLPAQFAIAAVLPREDPHDVLICQQAVPSISHLRSHAVIGTASTRRACQIKAQRPDLTIAILRGNIQTRLARLDDFDAIVLAAAGLKRMGLNEKTHYTTLPLTEFIPAAGQGTICIETLKVRADLHAVLAPLHCVDTWTCASVERQTAAGLEGGCHSPIGAYAWISKDEHTNLRVFVGCPNHQRTGINALLTLPCSQQELLAEKMLSHLEERGAKQLLLTA